MQEKAAITSKVLVHETNETHMKTLKGFFETNNLIGLKAEHHKNIIETLRTNIDLGAVFLCEEKDTDGKSGVDTAIEIHAMRKELPIFLRREGASNLDGLSEAAQDAITSAYGANNTDMLKELIDKYLFNTFYPSAMIRGIEEFSTESMESTFNGMEIKHSHAYLIRDRIIYGELFSLIPLESSWCRGYMMLQTEESSMFELIREGKTMLPSSKPDFRDLNSLMSEITNLIWGSFKSNFLQTSANKDTDYRIQVPIIIDHARKYITFGTEDPQLTFHYVLHDPAGKMKDISIYQKFVFHLNWSPEEFQEPAKVVDSLVESGELELF